MNQLIVNGLLTLGFCAGTVGSIGFEKDGARPYAWPLFLGGLITVAIVGLLSKLTADKAGAGSEEAHHEKQKYVQMISALRDKVVELDEGRASVDEEETRRLIDQLLANEYFDLTSLHEELVALIGFNDYARVWEGIANAERLLARAWSMATDGFADQGFAELPRARAQLERAAAAMAEV